MKRAVFVIFAISMGISLLLFRNSFADRCIENQNRLWGFHFGKREIWQAKVVTIIVGLGFIVCGLLCLFGIGRIK